MFDNDKEKIQNYLRKKDEEIFKQQLKVVLALLFKLLKLF